MREPALLVLSDGATFEGYAAGYLPEPGFVTGEFVFNTSLSGYQEVITDPSYAAQVIAFTFPHVGNYGVSPLDDEAPRPWCRGVVVRDLKPDGLFLSNGPGDPAPLDEIVGVLGDLIGTVPIFGICLGHQLLAMALGARTYKLPFGHHGSNHPVKDLATGRVEITAQNHNYAVAADSLARGIVSHINLNDGVIEGIASPGDRCFSVQYHPEAGPGPHDARYLFHRFESLLRHGQLESV